MIQILKLIYLNVTFYVLFVVYCAVGMPMLALFVTVGALFSSHRQTLRRLRRVIIWYGWVVVRILPFPLVRVEYRDLAANDVDGPYLIICNHRSLSDAWLMGLLPYELIQVAKGYVFRIPVLGIVARLAGYLDVNSMPYEAFSARVRELLRDGVSVVGFPEGTRSGSRAMGPFHGGIFRVALEAQCPIVPLCISGNEEIPARGTLLLRPGTIRVHKLPALRPGEYGHLSAFELKNRVRDTMAEHFATLERG